MEHVRIVRSTPAWAAFACSMLEGCAVDGYTWEQASRIEQSLIRVTEVADVGPICARYVKDRYVRACAVQRLDYCEIIVPPNSPGLVAHEAAHCLGYKHPGGHDITQWARGRRYAGDGEPSASAADSPMNLR